MHLLLFGYGISLLLNKNAGAGGCPLEQDKDLPILHACNSLSLSRQKVNSAFHAKEKKNTFLMTKDLLINCTLGQVLTISQRIQTFNRSLRSNRALLGCSFIIWPKEKQDFDFRKTSLMLCFRSECRAQFSGGSAFNCIYKKKIENMPAW